MKVLLISPKDPDKPGNLKFLMGGENTYTRSLLENPPPGVGYIYFEEALMKGYIEYLPWQKLLDYLIKFRILPLSPRILCFRINKKFDLIHSHSHAIKITGIKSPVILSDSSANSVFLKDYLGWNNLRIKLGYFIKRKVIRWLDIYDQELNLKDAKLLVWSKFAKKIHSSLGNDSRKITVIPPGIPNPKTAIDKKKGFNILFVGIWFERKGGRLLVEAYRQLKKAYPQVTLTLIGQIPKDLNLPKDVMHKNHLPRKIVMNKLLPAANVLVLVPPEVEGFGLVVLEASSVGIPSIVTSINALPELVVDGKTGFIIEPNNREHLYLVLEQMIKNPKLAKKMGMEAKKRYIREFSTTWTNKKLLQAYFHQISAWQQKSRLTKPKTYKR